VDWEHPIHRRIETAKPSLSMAKVREASRMKMRKTFPIITWSICMTWWICRTWWACARTLSALMTWVSWTLQRRAMKKLMSNPIVIQEVKWTSTWNSHMVPKLSLGWSSRRRTLILHRNWTSSESKTLTILPMRLSLLRSKLKC
jgi:hypothetical protein